jgi:hypothetical protein
VFVLRELALWLGTDTACRRILGNTLRETAFDFLELSEEAVVFRVRESRAVEDVVFVRCARQQSAQLPGATILLLAGLLRTRVVGAGILGRFLLLL